MFTDKYKISVVAFLAALSFQTTVSSAQEGVEIDEARFSHGGTYFGTGAGSLNVDAKATSEVITDLAFTNGATTKGATIFTSNISSILSASSVDTRTGALAIDRRIANPATTTTSATGSERGFAANGFIGFNRQVEDLVWGLEADWNKARESVKLGSSDYAKVDSIITARARLGKAVDRTLFYATGGAAWLAGSHTHAGNSYEDDIMGWVAGAGVEHVFESGWFTRLEYKHMEFDENSSSSSLKYEIELDTISIGVGFKS